MARLTRSRRTAAKSEAPESVSDPDTAPPAEKRTRRSRKQESKPVKEAAAPPPPPPIEEEPEVVQEQKPEADPTPQKDEAAPAESPAPEPAPAPEVTEAKPKKIEVEEEKLDFEVEDELQLKAQKDADIEEDTDETSKDQVSPPAAEAGEEKLTALDEMLKKRMSRRHSSAVDKENRKDRWGKLVEKAPVNDSRTQVVVTTDSLKELSAELQKEQSRKKSVDEGVSKDPPQSVVDTKAPEDSLDKTEEDNVRGDSEKKNKEDELNQKRKARHISMGDDNAGKAAPAESAQKPSSTDTRRAPTAGMALGTTNWDDLENHRRKPREESTPPKEQSSVYLLVNHLVRPFTLAQLTDFISHGNERVVTDLWLDKIKSKAIAVFETTEMSERAREELHNLVWPKGSPKTIKCEFLTPEQVEETKNPSEAKPPKNVGREEKKEARTEVKEEVPVSRDRSENGSGKAEGDDLRRTLDNHKDKDRLTDDRHHRHNRQERDESPPVKKIREWDLPKIQAQQKRQKEEPVLKEEPVKKDVDDSPCLESFFKKTSAMPPLYWLPLNEEQAIERAKTREAKQKEDDRQKLRQLRKNRRF